MTVYHLHSAIQSTVRMLPETAEVLKYVHQLCHLREDEHLRHLTHTPVTPPTQHTINTVKLRQPGWCSTAGAYRLNTTNLAINGIRMQE